MTFAVDSYRSFKKRRMLDPYLGAIENWPETLKTLDDLILKDDAHLFRHPLIQVGMYLTTDQRWQRAELNYLMPLYQEDQLREYLREEPSLAPYPIITDETFSTTESRVHHLTHLAVFREKTGIDAIGLDRVVEFGGGYGGMCALMRASTHIIVDFPVMLFLQSCYLSNRCGADRINLVLDESQPIKAGAINLVPIHFTDLLADLSAWAPDLMVSTWSLSEASKETQTLIAAMKFWGARHILHGSRGRARTAPSYFAGYEVLHDAKTFYSPSDYYLFMGRQ